MSESEKERGTRLLSAKDTGIKCPVDKCLSPHFLLDKWLARLRPRIHTHWLHFALILSLLLLCQSVSWQLTDSVKLCFHWHTGGTLCHSFVWQFPQCYLDIVHLCIQRMSFTSNQFNLQTYSNKHKHIPPRRRSLNLPIKTKQFKSMNDTCKMQSASSLS